MVIPRGHRLAARRVVDLETLASEQWIGVNSCPGYCRDVVNEACLRAGFKPRYGLEADEYPTAQGFVAAGLGVALIPLLALGAAAHSGVVVRRVKGEQPVRQVWSATRAAIADQVPVSTMLDDLDWAARRFVASMS
jgi:DNA-binding transcriptional LysR family regulator